MSGFSVSWLDLREGADFAARDKALAAQALEWFSTTADDVPIIVDLGSGTGSTLRALTTLQASSPQSSHKPVWRLVDHDPALLNEALRRHGKTHVIEDYEVDLRHIETLPLTGTRLVTASALFDLASLALVDALAARLAQHQSGLYAALNYDGTTTWSPAHPLDGHVLAAFNQDQRRDKGLGQALGPDAADYLQMALEKEGYAVFIGDSPWRLGPADEALISELIHGIAAAVAEGYGLDPQALQEWEAFRLANASRGTCTVGHLDVLAVPCPARD